MRSSLFQMMRSFAATDEVLLFRNLIICCTMHMPYVCEIYARVYLCVYVGVLQNAPD